MAAPVCGGGSPEGGDNVQMVEAAPALSCSQSLLVFGFFGDGLSCSGSSLHSPSAEMGVHHQAQFPDSLANNAQEMAGHGQLGEPLARLQGCLLGQGNQGSMRSFGTIKLSLMQETNSLHSAALPTGEDRARWALNSEPVRKTSLSPSVKQGRAEAGRYQARLELTLSRAQQGWGMAGSSLKPTCGAR